MRSESTRRTELAPGSVRWTGLTRFVCLPPPGTRPDDLTRPGHVVPVRAADRGVLQCRGTAEAAVDLCAIAGLASVAITATLTSDAGNLLQGTELAAFADEHHVEMVTVDDLADYVVHHGTGGGGRVCRLTEQSVRISVNGPFLIDFLDDVTGAIHSALTGPLEPGRTPTVHVTTACARWGSGLGTGLRSGHDDIARDVGPVTDHGGNRPHSSRYR
ncbi:3,4-dihydroxy-2-butanone-4-phosphate synthase [Gordonia humi]|uniref:3,4-dihydroxy-2-butanone-4-phosphate synthase n=1 Tax=Gordonia humi TaxID=686429 RepID=UPI00361220E3